MEHGAFGPQSTPARANLDRRSRRTAKFGAAACEGPQKPAKRFFLEGVDTPISANVASTSDGGFVLSQPLPFLSLNASLSDESGVGGTLSDVSVMVVDGVPHLLLDVDTACGAKREPTMSYLIESTRRARAGSEREPTIPFETRPFEAPSRGNMSEPAETPENLGLRSTSKQNSKPCMALTPVRDVQAPAVDLWSKLRVFFVRTMSRARNVLTTVFRRVN